MFWLSPHIHFPHFLRKMWQAESKSLRDFLAFIFQKSRFHSTLLLIVLPEVVGQGRERKNKDEDKTCFERSF